MNAAKLERLEDGRFLVSGVLNFDSVPALTEQGARLFQEQANQAVQVDLKGVTHSDSAGVALLIEWMLQAKRHNREIGYYNIPAQMLAIARVSSLDHVLPLGKDASEST